MEKAKSIEIIPIEGGKEEKLSLCQKVKLVFSNVTVEPILVCYILPSVMTALATQNLNLEKSCRVNLNLAQNVCDALANEIQYEDYDKDEQLVQTYSTDMAVYKNIIQSVVPAFLLLFLGSWSDRHIKRMPCILAPILGDMGMTLGLAISAVFMLQLPIEFNVLAESVPPSITGGWFAMFMGVFSYISGVTSEKSRTLRIGAVNMFINISICIGIALSGILFQKLGYYGVYSLGIAMYLIGFLYGLFFVKDIPKQTGEVEKVSFCRDFFDYKHVLETIKIAFKKGKRNRRKRVCLIMLLVMIVIGPMHGELNVVYYFVRYKYKWDSMDYSYFSTYQFVVQTLGTFLSLMIFTKYLNVDDTILGMFSSLSKVLASLVYAFAPTGQIFYLGALVEVLNGTSFIAMRSLISKMVPKEELGKINSLFGVCEAIVPLVYGPLYNKVYKATIKVFPGAFYVVGGVLTVPAIVIFLVLYFEHRKDLAEKETEVKPEQEPLKPAE